MLRCCWIPVFFVSHLGAGVVGIFTRLFRLMVWNMPLWAVYAFPFTEFDPAQKHGQTFKWPYWKCSLCFEFGHSWKPFHYSFMYFFGRKKYNIFKIGSINELCRVSAREWFVFTSRLNRIDLSMYNNFRFIKSIMNTSFENVVNLIHLSNRFVSITNIVCVCVCVCKKQRLPCYAHRFNERINEILYTFVHLAMAWNDVNARACGEPTDQH